MRGEGCGVRGSGAKEWIDLFLGGEAVRRAPPTLPPPMCGAVVLTFLLIYEKRLQQALDTRGGLTLVRRASSQTP